MQCYIITCGSATSRYLNPIHEKVSEIFLNFFFVIFINKANRLKSDKNNLFNKQPFLRKSDSIYFFSISILFCRTTYSHCLAHELFALVLHTHRKHSPQDLSWSALWVNQLTYFFLSVFSFTNIHKPQDSICCKIFKVCLTILGHYALEGQFLSTSSTQFTEGGDCYREITSTHSWWPDSSLEILASEWKSLTTKVRTLRSRKTRKCSSAHANSRLS